MPDLLAGTTITALDTPPTVSDTETAAYTATNTSYGTGSTGGSYVDCGTAFTACTTGRAKIDWGGQIDQSGADFAALSPVVRTGSTVGAGASILAADDARAVIMSNTDVMQMGKMYLLTGLTPGDSYNVRLEHRVGSGTGTFERRHVIVSPAT